MLGNILDSVSHRVEIQLNETIRLNEAFSENRWNLIETHVSRWSAYLVRYAILLPVAFAAWFILASVFVNAFTGYIPMPQQSIDNLDASRQLVMTAQVALIGIIYPLVIGFVGISLRGRASNRTLWHTYSQYSCAGLAGISAIELVATMASLEAITPWISSKTEAIASLTMIGWFLVNLFLIAWFLKATLQFIALDSRRSLILRFTLNEIIVDDIRRRLSPLLFQQSVLIDLDKALEAEIATFSMSTDNVSTYSRSFKREKTVVDAYMRPLAFAVNSWASRTSPGEESNLTLPISPYDSGKRFDLARFNQPNLSHVETLLLHFAFRFRSSATLSNTNLSMVINALAGNVYDALSSNNFRLFELALDELQELNKTLIDCLRFINDNEEPDNWMLLVDRAWLGRSYQDELNREYYQLAKHILTRIEESDSYFRKISHFYLGFYDSTQPTKLVVGFVRAHLHLWTALLNQTVETRLDEPEQRNHVARIRDFIGSWESWLTFVRADDRAENSNAASDIRQTHLQCTGMLVISALKEHAAIAADWAADALVYWFENLHPQSEPAYFRMAGLITFDDLKCPLDVGAIDPLGQRKVDATTIQDLALHNAWQDIRIVTAAYLLLAPQIDRESNEFELATRILEGKMIDENASVRGAKNLYTQREILSSYIRQQSSYRPGQDRGYPDWIESLLEDYNQSRDLRAVAGRVYSQWGAETDAIRTGIFLLLCLANDTEKGISNALEGHLTSDAISHEARMQVTVGLSRLAEERNNQSVLNKFSINADNAAQVSSHIDDLVKRLETFNATLVVRAEIDGDRLQEYNIAASQDAFSAENNTAPVVLFGKIGYYRSLDSAYEFKVNIENFDRANIAKGLDVQRAVNQFDWLSTQMTNSVRARIYQVVIEELAADERRAKDVMDALNVLIDATRQLKRQQLTPIIFLKSAEIRRILEDNLWGVGNSQLTVPVTKEDGKPRGYFCTLDGADIYTLPFRSKSVADCYVLANESMYELSFIEYADDIFTAIDFHEDEKDPAKGTLSFTFGLGVTIGKLPVLAISLD